ncbi:MAG: hypothetical protein CL450_07175, partial [Acidimicrobiaceae bacterium]|nr:hypothetical protein [Acidimicrobiaceae bacterium]
GVASDASDSDDESDAEEHDAASKDTTKNPPNLFIYFLPPTAKSSCKLPSSHPTDTTPVSAENCF